jgi:hypothetical protein
MSAAVSVLDLDLVSFTVTLPDLHSLSPCGMGTQLAGVAINPCRWIEWLCRPT